MPCLVSQPFPPAPCVSTPEKLKYALCATRLDDQRVTGAWDESDDDDNELELGPMSQKSVKFPSLLTLSGWGAPGDWPAVDELPPNLRQGRQAFLDRGKS